MYMFNPFYSTVNPLRMYSLALCVVDIVHVSNSVFGHTYLGIEMVELTAQEQTIPDHSSQIYNFYF